MLIPKSESTNIGIKPGRATPTKARLTSKKRPLKQSSPAPARACLAKDLGSVTGIFPLNLPKSNRHIRLIFRVIIWGMRPYKAPFE
jgi:hypothetical protein